MNKRIDSLIEKIKNEDDKSNAAAEAATLFNEMQQKIELLEKITNSLKKKYLEKEKEHIESCPENAKFEDKLDHIEFLFLKGEINVFEVDSNGNTYLHKASQKGSFKAVKFLVEDCFLDINCKNNFGLTPLDVAAINSQKEVVNYLYTRANIEKSSDDFITNCINKCSIHAAAEIGDIDTVGRLIDEFNKKKEFKDIKELNDDKGRTPLHIAVIHKQLEMVKYLTEQCSVAISPEDNLGNKPFNYAVENKDKEMIIFFRDDLYYEIDDTLKEKVKRILGN